MEKLLPIHVRSRSRTVFERRLERKTGKIELPCIALPLLKLVLRTRRIPRFSALVEKNFLDVLAENASDLKSKREARVVPARLNGVDAGTRHSHMHGEFGLRPFPL